MSYEKRAMPILTKIIIAIMIFVLVSGFLFLQFVKEQKIIEILAPLGHTNISSIKVINKLTVEDVDTKIKSSVFKVKFYDDDLKQTCIGFLHHEKDNTYTKDLDCK